MTFHHTFQNGHTATATLTVEGLKVEWQPDVLGKGHREEIKAEYLTWTRQCFQIYADKVGGAVEYLNLATGEPDCIHDRHNKRLTARRTSYHAMTIPFQKLPEFRKLSARARGLNFFQLK
jgi:hypothetical protein